MLYEQGAWTPKAYTLPTHFDYLVPDIRPPRCLSKEIINLV